MTTAHAPTNWEPPGNRAFGGAVVGALGGAVWILLLFLRWLRRDQSLPSVLECLSALGVSVVVGVIVGLLQPAARTPLRSIACGAVTGALLLALSQVASALRAAPPMHQTYWTTFLFLLPLFVTCGALVWILFLYVDPALAPAITVATAGLATDRTPRRLTGGNTARVRWATLVVIVAGLYGCTTSLAPYSAGLILLVIVLVQLSSPPLTQEVELWVSPDALLVQHWRGTTRVPIQQLAEVVALPITGVKPTSVSKEVVTLGAMLRLGFTREARALPRDVYAVVPNVPDLAPLPHAEAWAGILLRWRDDAIAGGGGAVLQEGPPSAS